eukprot:g2592.t1
MPHPPHPHAAVPALSAAVYAATNQSCYETDSGICVLTNQWFQVPSTFYLAHSGRSLDSSGRVEQEGEPNTGKQIGPKTQEDMKALLLSQHITHETLMWRQGLAEWKPVGKCLSLINVGFIKADVALYLRRLRPNKVLASYANIERIKWQEGTPPKMIKSALWKFFAAATGEEKILPRILDHQQDSVIIKNEKNEYVDLAKLEAEDHPHFLVVNMVTTGTLPLIKTKERLKNSHTSHELDTTLTFRSIDTSAYKDIVHAKIQTPFYKESLAEDGSRSLNEGDAPAKAVRMRLSVFQLYDIDAVQQQFTIDFQLECSWTDYSLKDRRLSSQEEMVSAVSPALITVADTPPITVTDERPVGLDKRQHWTPCISVVNAVDLQNKEHWYKIFDGNQELGEDLQRQRLDSRDARLPLGDLVKAISGRGQDWTPLFERNPIVCQRLRARGHFQERFELANFPLDYQLLQITIMSGRAAHAVSLEQNPSPLYRSRVFCGETFLLQDFYELSPHIVAQNGLTEAGTSGDSIATYPLMTFQAQIQRKYMYWVFNVIVPLSLIVTMSFSSLLVSIEEEQDRVMITLTMLLTTIAFKNYVSSFLPNLNHLTWIDGYVLLCIFLQTAVGIENMIIAHHYEGSELFKNHNNAEAFNAFLAGWLTFHALVIPTAVSMCRREIRSARNAVEKGAPLSPPEMDEMDKLSRGQAKSSRERKLARFSFCCCKQRVDKSFRLRRFFIEAINNHTSGNMTGEAKDSEDEEAAPEASVEDDNNHTSGNMTGEAKDSEDEEAASVEEDQWYSEGSLKGALAIVKLKTEKRTCCGLYPRHTYGLHLIKEMHFDKNLNVFPGDQVYILEGPHAGYRGIVASLLEHSHCRVWLDEKKLEELIKRQSK